jgi:ribosomal protein S18 acetylase RimI-like enzyme
MATTIRSAQWQHAASAELAIAAQLMAEAGSTFYALFGISEAALLESLTRQLLASESEIARGLAAFADGQLRAVAACFPAAQMRSRQLASLMVLLGEAGVAADAQARLRRYGAELVAVPPDSYYLARIGVAAEQRGRGLGRELIAAFERLARDSGFALASLHVARDNAGAIAFYEALGYRDHVPDSGSMRAMTKELR